MLELFIMETSQQCLTLNQQMAMAADDQTRVDYGELHRALHSIGGAARIIDLPVVVQLAHALGAALSLVPGLSDDQGLWGKIVAGIGELNKITVIKAGQLRQVIKQNKDIIQHTIDALSAAVPSAPDQTSENIGLPDQNQTDKSDPAAPAISTDIFAIFKEDVQNHLVMLTDAIIKLEKHPDDGILVEASMRAAHSIKGAARILGLSAIVRLAHAMEDILLGLQNKDSSLSLKTTDNLLAGCDLLKGLSQINIGQLEEWLKQNDIFIDNIRTALASPEDTGDGGDTAPASSIDRSRPAPPPKTANLKEDSGIAERTVRVSARNMNRLMGLAGEAIVESDWLPMLMKKTQRLKTKQEEIWAEINNIHKRLLENGIPPYLEDSFAYLNHRVQYCRDFIGDYIGEIDDHVCKAAGISHQLQREVVANQMQPFSEGIKGLPRLIRDLSSHQNKQIRFEVEGAETPIDRDIMEKLEAPLTHIITNAVDHGVESAKVRKKAGKPAEATIKITARHAAGLLCITISDDGSGVNFAALRKKIVADKLVSREIAKDLKESELLEFLFLPNFSTISTISESSGRGVGLDVVHNIIRQIRGNIEVSSEPGHGSYFELRLPLTLSIICAVVAEINNEPYAFPLVNIDHIVRLNREDIQEMAGRQYIISQNKYIGIVPACQVLDLADQEPDNRSSIIVLENDNTPYGLIVDRLYGIRDLVVQPLAPRLGKLRSINAAAIAEDGTPILILDVHDLVVAIDHLISGKRLQPIATHTPSASKRQEKRVLVVDDSTTVREVERSLLVKYGFAVDVAEDGIDAWNLMKHERYALIITDVDMPQMDGIELLCLIRESQDFEELPVIIVSYKDREEDKHRGLDAGADYYLTKGSFTDKSFIEAVHDLIGYPEKAA